MLLQGLLRALPDDHPHRAKLTAAEKDIKQVELVNSGSDSGSQLTAMAILTRAMFTMAVLYYGYTYYRPATRSMIGARATIWQCSCGRCTRKAAVCQGGLYF